MLYIIYKSLKSFFIYSFLKLLCVFFSAHFPLRSKYKTKEWDWLKSWRVCGKLWDWFIAETRSAFFSVCVTDAINSMVWAVFYCTEEHLKLMSWAHKHKSSRLITATQKKNFKQVREGQFWFQESNRRRSPPADFWIRTHSEALTTLLFITKKHVSIIPRNGNNVGQMLRLNQSWKHRYALKVQFQTLDIPVREWVYFVSDSGWIQCNIHDKLPRVCCLFFSECSFSKPETSLYQAKCIFWHHLQ